MAGVPAAVFGVMIPLIVADRFRAPVTFVGLACVAALGLMMVWTIMPETRREAA
jgi:ABC-type enterochelin transport system permease subunit